MKRKLLLLLALMAIGLSNVWAYYFRANAPSGQQLYYYTSGGNAEVMFMSAYYSNLTGALVIPASVTYNGTTYSVTTIGSSAFSGCSGLTSVFIPNSVTSIGGDAFRDCSGLTSINVHSGNTYYDSRNNCNAIIETNTNKLIAGCKNTIIPNSVTSIETGAFRGCSGLTSVTIPSSVTSIGDFAFYDCSGLTSVTIGNSVTSIGETAFWGCSGLTSVTIPNSVTTIGNNAFGQVRLVSYCGSATGSPWGGTRVGCFYEDGEFIFEDATQTTILAYIGTGSSVTIPNSVTTIGDSAFSGCSGLTSVTIPNSVTTIEAYAFKNCSGLTSVTIGNSVTSIGNYAFENCRGLTSVTIPNSVTTIGSSAFYGCRGLTSVTIPNSVTSIGNYAFYGCSGLTSVTIGNSVTYIGSFAFEYCSGLTSVTIGNSVTYIGSFAFKDCSGLTSVTIGNSVTSIGDDAFFGCSGLTSVTIGNSVTSIGTSAFCGCSNVDTLYYNARNLTTTSYSLFGSMGLKYLVIGDSVRSLPSYVFYGQDSLSSVTIPNSVTSIGNYAFYGCSGLTSVSIPNSVTSIGSYAFYGCSGLTSVTIPNSVTSIGGSAFYNCSGLTSVTIGNSVTSIGSSAFDGCSGLTSVTIGNSVTFIGNYAFYNCNGLTSVTMRGTVPPTLLGGSVFYGNASNRKIYVPCGAYETYCNATNGWSNYRIYLSDPIVDIDVTVNAESGGSASIIPLRGQNVRCDSTIVVTATPNYGYHFDHWSTGSTLAQDTIAIEGDTVITAYFAKNQYAVNVVPNYPARGNVYGSDTIDYLDSITISAVANYGYHFTRWNDNDTHQVRTVQVTQNKTYTAYFDYNQYQLSVVSSDTIQGLCTGSGTYNYLANRTIRANANYGYHFVQWNDGNTDNPRTIQLTQDTLFTAEFVKNQYAINVVPSNANRGQVFGSDTIDYLDSITISAVANYGYHFTRWNDNDTHQVRTVQVTQNKTYTAYFDYNQYQLSVVSSDTIQGLCTGSGTYNYLANRTISATANYGYHFAHWSDGSNENPRTILLTQDTIITAVFAKNQYAVNVVSSDTVRGYVTGSDTIDYLDSITISAVANYGYHFTRWNDNDTHQVRTVQVTQNKTYTAYFDYNQYQLTAASADTVQGTCSGSGAYSYLANRTIQATANYGYHFTQWNDGNTENPRTIQLTQDTIFTAEFAKNQYTIVLLSDDASLGSMSGGGTFDYLDTITLMATPIDHHHLVRWSDGNRENLRQWVVTSDTTLTAYFAIDTHSVTVVSNDPTRGMVTSSGSEFAYLNPCTVTATAYTGFVFTGWSNGVTANPYTFAVQSDVELTAIFVSEDELMFTITVETDDPTMGSVSGGGMAMSGGEVTIHAVANEGYHFVRWNDNDTNADRTVIVTEDATYTAYFASDQTQGIDEVEQMPTIVVRGNSITVANAQNQMLSIYDVTGRMIVREKAVDGKAYTMPNTGVYMVQVGNHPAEKVVVIK